jgi:arylsulfatase A-like enzyme
VPLIAAWPGTIAPGRRSDRPVGLIDLYPTFAEVAGATPPAGQPLDGGSLAPLLLGREDPPPRDLFWHFPGYLGGETAAQVFFRSRPTSIIRRGDWKLHLFHEPWALKGGRAQLDTNGAVALYNLAQDPGERADLAQAQPVKRDELLDALLAWFAATEAKLASEPNPRFAPRKPMKDAY